MLYRRQNCAFADQSFSPLLSSPLSRLLSLVMVSSVAVSATFSWWIASVRGDDAHNWTTPDGVHHEGGNDPWWSPQPLPAPAAGVAVTPPDGVVLNPSSAFAGPRFLAFFRTKTAWGSPGNGVPGYGLGSVRNPNDCDRDSVGYQCTLPSGEGVHWETWPGPGWDQIGDYTPAPLTAPGWIDVDSDWRDTNHLQNRGVLDTTCTLAFRERIALVGVQEILEIFTDRAWRPATGEDGVLGDWYRFRAKPDPVGAAVSPSLPTTA